MATVYRFEGFELEPTESRLVRGGEPIAAQPKVLDALRLFVESPGRLLSKQELLAGLWPGAFVSEESLTQVVRKLRLVLGDDPQAPRFVETIPRRGYRFLATVEVVRKEAAQPAPPVAIPTAVPMSGGRLTRYRWSLGAALAGAAAATILGLLLAHRRVEPPVTPSAAGPSQRRLTATPGRETYPALSPEGDRYAFVLRAPGEPRYDLYAAPIDGEPVRLTADSADDYAPQFSPDGREILFTRAQGEERSLWRLPALGGAPTLVVAGAEEGAWTADGRAVLYVRREPGPLFVVRRRQLATGDDVALWRVWDALASLAVSPDGERLAAVAGERRVLIGPARAPGEPRLLAGPVEYVRSLAWLPSGVALVADGHWPGHSGNLMRLPLDGGPVLPLTVGANGLFHPTVDRQGRILYARESKTRQVVRLDGELRPVGELAVPTAVECFDVAPDGSSLAITDWDSPAGRGALSLLDLATGGVRPLGDGLCPAYSPDGSRLAFLGATRDTLGLWLLELATGSRRRLAADGGKPGLIEENAARRPAWSPDGRRVAYVASGTVEGSGVFVVDVASQHHALVAPGIAGQLAWSPDGRRLAVSGEGEAQGFVIVDVRGRAVRRVFASQGNYRVTPVWVAPDRVGFLVDQRTRPTLVVLDATRGVVAARRPVDVALEPSFWGVYELLPDRRGGWLAVVETYESDLYLLAAGAAEGG